MRKSMFDETKDIAKEKGFFIAAFDFAVSFLITGFVLLLELIFRTFIFYVLGEITVSAFAINFDFTFYQAFAITLNISVLALFFKPTLTYRIPTSDVSGTNKSVQGNFPNLH
jgi:membrane protein implicated in regulation of membrane protease activity